MPVFRRFDEALDMSVALLERSLRVQGILKDMLKPAWVVFGFFMVFWNYVASILLAAIAGSSREQFFVLMIPGWAYALISLRPAIRGIKKRDGFIVFLWINILVLSALPIAFLVVQAFRWVRAVFD